MSIGMQKLFNWNNWNNWNMWPFLFEESSHQVERPPLTYDLILGRTDRMILFNFRKKNKKNGAKGSTAYLFRPTDSCLVSRLSSKPINFLFGYMSPPGGRAACRSLDQEEDVGHFSFDNSRPLFKRIASGSMQCARFICMSNQPVDGPKIANTRDTDRWT